MRLAESNGKGGLGLLKTFSHTHTRTHRHTRLADTHVDCGFHLSQINENAAGKSSLHALSEQSTLPPPSPATSPFTHPTSPHCPPSPLGYGRKVFGPFLNFGGLTGNSIWAFSVGASSWPFLVACTFQSCLFICLFARPRLASGS